MVTEYAFPSSRAEWFEVVAAAAEGGLPSEQAEQLPGFPHEALQVGTTGQAGRATLLEAFRFYEDTCRAFERIRGRPLGSGDKVLDFGTGWGRILRFFVREVGTDNCYGTDVNPELVATCRELFSSNNFAANPAFPPSTYDDNSFSLIVGYSVFSHLSEAACRAWMKEFFRILNPDGLVAVTTRGRWFFDYCDGLKARANEGGYTEGLANLFDDFEAAKAKYDGGEIVHATSDTVSGGKVLGSGFYGETFIPERWAHDDFRPLMKLAEFYEAPDRQGHPILFLAPVVDGPYGVKEQEASGHAGANSAGGDKEAALRESATVVSTPWKGSPYYDEAESWLHVFWNEGTVFRRLFGSLDLSRAVELAVGHGRHAEVVAPKAGELIVMDVFQENLDVCMRRLREYPNVQFKRCQGYSFDGVEDGWATSVYCYDAMVHFSPDIVESYLKDTYRILERGGRGLFHHSNYAAPLDRNYGLNPHARNHMTQALFARLCDKAGLKTLESEIIDWGGESMLE